MSAVIIEKQQIYKAAGVICLLLIGFFTWIVVTTYGLVGKVDVIQENQKTGKELQQTMWHLVLDNNKILQTKAGEAENKEQHEKIMLKMEGLEIGLREISAGRKYTSSNYDTTNRYGGSYNKVTTKPPPLIYGTDN